MRSQVRTIPGWLLPLVVAGAIHASVKLPALISNHMVLQQGTRVRIWGMAGPGEAVRLEFREQTITATAAGDGKWEAWLEPLTAGGPDDLTVAGRNRITVKDVLVGEVWLGAGQSNMEFPVAYGLRQEEEIAGAKYPQMRFFHAGHAAADQPAEDLSGAWEVCSPETVRQ